MPPKAKSREEKLAKARAIKPAEINRNAFWQEFAKNVMAEYQSIEFFIPEDLTTCRTSLRSSILDLGDWIEKRLLDFQDTLEITPDEAKQFAAGITTGITVVVSDDEKTSEDWKKAYSDLQDQFSTKEKEVTSLSSKLDDKDKSILDLKTKVSELSNELELKNNVSKITNFICLICN